MSLREQIEELAHRAAGKFTEHERAVFDELKAALNLGEVRAAERTPGGEWLVNAWVKRGILLGFRMGVLRDMSASDGSLRFFDKDTYPVRELSVKHNVRIVPGGSSIRDGAYVAPGVVCMPPMYVNVGAYVDEGTMIDSHALVGSCAQVGKRVHLSAAAQIGGVLEPVGAVPVIIEDDVLVGGGCGVYEGTIVRERAVLAAGTILTGSTPVFDLVRERIYRRQEDSPLEIPAGAVVVPGTRAVESERGRAWGLSLYAPVIVKYRDEKTDRAAQLEDYLR
ncbi:MAG TPA: 2,3,4,5-tetrahydropyridine-2,6-dicarboxylate N-succinyltransferase [Pyrinomonadaceae bacterium]|jgi:2,3,4,5-tetrahydropyridine-2-carboxylate N-succinyltransferase|nr:2,3,4,5-tetrahydropyridine-2,6-dicarboxylate N-succinyltransferase [Pyrinomonadaceae bacterium]